MWKNYGFLFLDTFKINFPGKNKKKSHETIKEKRKKELITEL